MHAATALHDRVTPMSASPVAALLVDSYELDMPRVAIPRPEIHVVARFGPSARNGLDVHVLGPRQTVHRKTIRGGQWALMARIQLGAPVAIFGVPVSRLADRITPLGDLWGDTAAERLTEQLAAASTRREAAAVLDRAISERPRSGVRNGADGLAMEAARRLPLASVNAVADDLGVSERHLRRVFREAVGVSPKAFATLARFRRALHAAHENAQASWASVAATAGYYDQAHLIADFRAIAGVTPRAFLRELGASQARRHVRDEL
jgi:AraC-like DNA-binding protein